MRQQLVSCHHRSSISIYHFISIYSICCASVFFTFRLVPGVGELGVKRRFIALYKCHDRAMARWNIWARSVQLWLWLLLLLYFYLCIFFLFLFCVCLFIVGAVAATNSFWECPIHFLFNNFYLIFSSSSSSFICFCCCSVASSFHRFYVCVCFQNRISRIVIALIIWYHYHDNCNWPIMGSQSLSLSLSIFIFIFYFFSFIEKTFNTNTKIRR